MSKKKVGLGFVTSSLVIAAAIIVSAFSFIHKRLIKRPLEGVLERIILPLLDTLDDEYGGILVFFIFLIELIILIFVPWFFSWKIGLIIFMHVITTVAIALLLIDNDNNKNWKVSFFITWITPYLIMGFIPTAILTIVRKKDKPEPTIIQMRKTKLKLLKKKIRINKLKFWNK